MDSDTICKLFCAGCLPKCTKDDQIGCGVIEQVNKVAKYYEEVIIPQKIKEAEEKLIEEIDRDGKCGNGDIDYPLVEWNKLKKSRGIE